MKNYTMALKNDKENFNVWREQSYLQLYLRLYQSFLDTAKKCIDLKPNLVVNWVTYSFANYLQKNFVFAEKIIDSAINLVSQNETVKKEDIFELKSYKLKLLILQEKSEDAIEYLIKNEADYLDKGNYNKDLAYLYIKTKKFENAKTHLTNLIKTNPENMEYYIERIKIYLYENNKEEAANKVFSFTDLLEQGEKDKSILKNIYDYLVLLKEEFKDCSSVIKSMVLYRLQLASLTKETGFESEIKSYFKKYFETTNPSVIINISWIYDYQSDKVELISQIFSELLKEVTEKESVFGVDLIPIISWFYFTYAIHCKILKNYSEALDAINKAIDLTPSVIEFFIIKSTILKRVFLFKESEKAYEKARKLDIGDRYLNAKHAKAAIRAGNYMDGQKIMLEFVKETIDDEHLDHTQTTWYIVEVAASNLRNGEYAVADRLLNALINVFHSLYEDQFDFFNYCLRRNVVCHLIDSMNYLDRVFDHSHFYKGLELIDYLYEFACKTVNEKNNKLDKEMTLLNETTFKTTKYKFDSFNSIKEKIVKELLAVIVKNQVHSKNEIFHYIAVKYSLLNIKPLLALKSLNFFISNNKTSSTYYKLSLDLLAKYINNFLIKDNTDHSKIILEVMNEAIAETKNISKFTSDASALVDLKTQNFLKSDNKSKSFKEVSKELNEAIKLAFHQKDDVATVKKMFENILLLNLEQLKCINYKNYSRLITIGRLFIDVDFINDWDKRFKEKFSEFAHPSKTIYNLDFYDIYNENKKPKFDN